MTTGMTKAERWAEVARRVWGGAFFGDAVFGVFGDNPANLIGDAGWTNWDLETDDEYDTYYGMLALFLSYEAEDEEGERLLIEHLIDSHPEPVTMVAAEEPVARGGMAELVEAQAEYNRRIAPVMVSVADFGAVTWTGDEERRSSWNAKLADGMRKWADWVEARF